ncbi:MAG: sister chromatid cohesion protein PDS5 [Gemmataceae bacterium]
MRRIFLALLAATLAFAPAARGDDDDPEFGKRKLSEWIKMLHDKESAFKMRRGALLVMEIYGPKIRGVVPAVAKALRTDESVEIRTLAAQSLGQMGEDAEDAASALAESVKSDKADQVRATAAAALGKLGTKGKSSASALATAVKDKAAPVRQAAVESLGLIGADPNDVLEAVLTSLKDPDAKVRFQGVVTLFKLGPKSAALAVPDQLNNMVAKDDSAAVRAKTAEVLNNLGKDAAGAATGLIAALGDNDENVRRWAVLALGKIGEPARPALPKLAAILNGDSKAEPAVGPDPDEFVRGHAVQTIASLGKESVPALARCVENEPLVEVRLLAIRELGKMGDDAAPAVPALKKAAGDGRAVIREAAQNALKKISG